MQYKVLDIIDKIEGGNLRKIIQDNFDAWVTSREEEYSEYNRRDWWLMYTEDFALSDLIEVLMEDKELFYITWLKLEGIDSWNDELHYIDGWMNRVYAPESRRCSLLRIAR